MADPKFLKLVIYGARVAPRSNRQPSQQSQAVFDEKLMIDFPSIEELVIHIKCWVLGKNEMPSISEVNNGPRHATNRGAVAAAARVSELKGHYVTYLCAV